MLNGVLFEILIVLKEVIWIANAESLKLVAATEF